MRPGVSRQFCFHLAGACLVAVIVCVPSMFSAVSARAHEFAKMLVAVPLCLVAACAVLWAAYWRPLPLSTRSATFVAVAALALFLVIAATGTLVADVPTIAYFGRFYRLEGFVVWLAYGAFFVALLWWLLLSGREKAIADVMLLASLVPAAYAIMQASGLDFYSAPGSEVRVTSTLGNPVLLGGYLAVMLPAAVARCRIAPVRSLQRVVWIALALLQTAALWLTQARGAMVAAVLGLAVLGIVIAARARARVWLISAGTLIAVSMLVVVGANMAAPVRSLAQAIPGLDRMVFDLGPDANLATRLASRSIVSRLGTWQAGIDVFSQASVPRKLFGYGPESAQPNLYPYIPASVMSAEDFRTTENFDRLHADVLDMILNFGIVGWLLHVIFYGAVVRSAAVYLFGRRSAGTAGGFVALATACALAATAAAWLSGLQSAMPAAFGLGIGVAWALYLGLCAWRDSQLAIPYAESVESGKWLLVAGLIAALLAFWTDSQVNFPLISTRIAAFAMAALIFAITVDSPMLDTVKVGVRWSRPDGTAISQWGFACALIATLASTIPPVDTTNVALMAEVTARMPVLAVLLAAAVLGMSWSHGGMGWQYWRSLLWIGGLSALYFALHISVRPRLGTELEAGDVYRMALTRLLATVFLLAACAGHAWSYVRGAAKGVPPHAVRPAIAMAVAAVGLAAALATFANMAGRALVGDVAAASSQFVGAQGRKAGDTLAQMAVTSAGWEWRHRKDFIYRNLGHALAEVTPQGVALERRPNFRAALDVAEQIARNSVAALPRDPWAALALAKVLQLRSLAIVRDVDPRIGAAAAIEVDAAYERAFKMFPNQPLTLQGWAQVKFNAGLNSEGYHLLDMMEAIVPREPDAYAERIAASLRLRDYDDVEATLARANMMLSPDQVSALAIVAKKQHE